MGDPGFRPHFSPPRHPSLGEGGEGARNTACRLGMSRKITHWKPGRTAIGAPPIHLWSGGTGYLAYAVTPPPITDGPGHQHELRPSHNPDLSSHQGHRVSLMVVQHPIFRSPGVSLRLIQPRCASDPLGRRAGSPGPLSQNRLRPGPEAQRLAQIARHRAQGAVQPVAPHPSVVQPLLDPREGVLHERPHRRDQPYALNEPFNYPHLDFEPKRALRRARRRAFLFLGQELRRRASSSNRVSVRRSFQLPKSLAPRMKPRWMSISRVKPRQRTMLPGGLSWVLDR